TTTTTNIKANTAHVTTKKKICRLWQRRRPNPLQPAREEQLREPGCSWKRHAHRSRFTGQEAAHHGSRDRGCLILPRHHCSQFRCLTLRHELTRKPASIGCPARTGQRPIPQFTRTLTLQEWPAATSL